MTVVRLLLCTIALLAAAFVTPMPAYARTFHLTTVVSKTGLPTGIKVVHVSCPESSPGTPGVATTAFRHVFGPTTTPVGVGSLRVEPTANTLPGLLISSNAQLGALSSLSVDLNSDIPRVNAHIFPNGSTWVLSRQTQAFSGGWSQNILSGSGWTWTDGITLEGPGTVQDFATAHPPSSAGFKIELLSGNCGAISTFPNYFDNLIVGYPASATKYDFESRKGGLTITVNHATIAAGSSVKVSTVFTDGGEPVQGRHVALYAKPQGASSFTKIRTFYPTTASGGASFTLRPAKTTTYQWRYNGGDPINPTKSPTKTVDVTH